MYQLYSVIVKAFNEKLYKEILLESPIASKSNGSIMWMKGSPPMLDYINVELEDINDLILYFENNKITEYEIEMRPKSSHIIKPQVEENKICVESIIKNIEEKIRYY